MFCICSHEHFCAWNFVINSQMENLSKNWIRWPLAHAIFSLPEVLTADENRECGNHPGRSWESSLQDWGTSCCPAVRHGHSDLSCPSTPPMDPFLLQSAEKKYVTVLLLAHIYTCPVPSQGYSFLPVVKTGFPIEVMGRYLRKKKALTFYSSLHCWIQAGVLSFSFPHGKVPSSLPRQ